MVRPTSVDQIKGKQMQDEELVKKVHKIMNGEIGENFSITQDEVLTMKGRVCVPNVEDLRKLIMKEAYYSAYAMHLGSTKMYQTIKENYWWSGDVSNCKCTILSSSIKDYRSHRDVNSKQILEKKLI